MMLHNEQLHAIRLIHYTCRLPVALYEWEQCIASLPEQKGEGNQTYSPKSLPPGLTPIPHQIKMPQYLQSTYGQQYVYFELENNLALLCGPFVIKSMTDAEIQRHIRTLKLPLDKRDELELYYRTLPQCTEDNCFYLGKLLERIFCAESPLQAAPPTLLTDVGKPYFEQTYENRMSLFEHPPYFLEQEIVRLVAHGNRENALHVLSEINRLKRATLAKDPLRSLKNSLICSCTLFTRAAIQGGVPADEAFTLSDAFIQTIEGTENLKKLDMMEESMVLAFIEHVKAHNKAALSGMIRSAITYIDHHLSEKITVPLIAVQVFVHPDYLSSKFKQETGTSITDFVQKRRIEEACHFLRYSQNTVSEIAAFYQFCSQSHFIQVFKKHMGITPARYKNSV